MRLSFRLVLYGMLIEKIFGQSGPSYGPSLPSAGGGCQSGTYRSDTRRRFLHTRPLSEPLPSTPVPWTIPSITTPTTPPVPDDVSRLGLPPVYYLERAVERAVERASNRNPNKLSSLGVATTRFEMLTRDTSSIHWEKKIPTAPIPRLPLYWINLGRSKTRGENMAQQLRQLQWNNATRIEAFDGKATGGTTTRDKYNAVRNKIHVGKTPVEALPCFGKACTPSQLATLLSHLRALRQAWADGHEHVLIAEDDVDFILYDETVLQQVVQKLPAHWGSLQLYTGNSDLMEVLFKEFPATGFAPRNTLVHPWSQACVLYNRKGMKQILDQFGYHYKYDFTSLPLNGFTHGILEADSILPRMLGASAFISARPMVNVHFASSTIDEHHFKALLADMTISTFAHRFQGKAWGVTTYGPMKEIFKTASHLRALAHAYKAGLDRVIVADQDLSVDNINFRAVASVINKAVCVGRSGPGGPNGRSGRSGPSKSNTHQQKTCVSNGIVQLLAPKVTGGAAEPGEQHNTTVLLPGGVQWRPKDDYRFSVGATSLYAVVGRKALQAFSELWDEKTSTVTVPFNGTFVADFFMYNYLDTVVNGSSPPVYVPYGRNIQHMPGRIIKDPFDVALDSIRRSLTASRLLYGCADCPAGKKGQKLPWYHGYCVSCNSGTFSVAAKALSCSNCGAGQYSPSSTESCQVCAAGKISPINPNTAYDCTECPKGKHGQVSTNVIDHDNANDCHVCGEGSYADETGTSVCKVCGKGMYNSAAGYPDGAASDHDNTNDCTVCGSGQYADHTGSGSCLQCATGTYTDGVTQSDHDDANDCLTCAAGQGFVGTSCVACPQGYYQPMNAQAAVSCKSCPIGYHQPSTNGVGCSSCAIGKYSDEAGPIVCKFCAAGYYVPNQLPRSSCTGCLSGQYQPYSQGAVNCISCPHGFYQPSPDSNDCKVCQTAKYQTSNTNAATTCHFCPQGFSYRSTTLVCGACIPGRYQESNSGFASTQCTACPDGRYVSTSQAVTCKLCSEGTYGDDTVPNTNTTHCTSCAKGQYTGSTGEVSCKNCAIGFYNPTIGQAMCLACTAASMPTVPGQTTCAGCHSGKAGTYDANASPSFGCEDCAAGQYAGGGFTACKACPKGYYTASAAAGFCTACPLGSYDATPDSSGTSMDEATACLLCGAGKFGVQQAAYDEGFCHDCPEGFYSQEPGGKTASSCNSCLPGKTSNTAGRGIPCDDCAKGMYQPLFACTGACANCPSGFYQNFTGQASCDICFPGKHQPSAQSTTCVDCVAGMYSVTTQATRCHPCTAGHHQDEPGQTFCFECSRGQFQPGTQQAGCLKCNPHDYTDKPGQSNCSHCTTGQFSEGT